MNVPSEFSKKRKAKKRAFFEEQTHEESLIFDGKTESEEEAKFQCSVFYVVVDSVLAGLTTRFEAIDEINNLFRFLWSY